MKKRTLLTFAATSAVVMTTAASYAVWDVTNVSKEVSITTGKGVTVSSTDLNFTGTLANSSINGLAELETDLTISIDGLTDVIGKKLKFSTSNMTLDGVTNASAVNVTIMQDSKDITLEGDTTLEEANNYKVRVSLPSDAKAEDYATKTIKFNLNADLVVP